MTERAKKLLLLYYKQGRKIRRVSGLPPLTFKGKGKDLKNYRIYGNTVNGENVGDLITEGEHAGEYSVPVTVEGKNLFEINNLEDRYDISIETGLPTRDSPYSNSRCAITTPINVSAGDYYLTFNKNIAGEIGFIVSVFENNTLISRTAGYYSGSRIRISSGNNIYIGFYNQNVADIIHPSDISNIMLNEGTTPLPYEPYRTPVTTPIYLPEPIKMVGDEAGYIDYAEQKQHRVRKNLINIETDIIPLGFQYGTVAIFSDLNIKGFFKECEPNTAYTMSRKTSSNNRFSIGFSAEEPPNNSSVALLSYTTPFDTSATSLTLISPANAKYICCYLSNQGDDITEALEIMLEKNDRATDYEPYIEDTDLDVTLPELPTLAGTNVLTVGTEVQPSSVEIKGRIKAAGGD